ncbi:MAG: peptidase E [Patescibacteria group bacterium]
MAKTKIIAIGGGSVRTQCAPPTTLSIDQEAVRLAASELPVGRDTVNVLFLPTASLDDMAYCHNIYTQFHLRLGCNYEHLLLAQDKVYFKEISSKIAWADIIYVGGGNTREMMNIWNETGVSNLLRSAHAQGKVMMGLSAGSICWFEAGLSDSNKFIGIKNWKPIWVKGLGLLPFYHSPHHNSEDWRRNELDYLSEQKGFLMPVISVDDDCALQVIGDEYRVLSSNTRRNAYLYHGHERTTLSPHEDFRPLSELFI